MQADQIAEQKLKTSMKYARGQKNKASIYTQTYMLSALQAAKQAKRNLPFWTGLGFFQDCKFKTALKFFKKAAETPKGRQLISLIVDERRLEDSEVETLASLARVSPKRAISRNHKRREAVAELEKKIGGCFTPVLLLRRK